MMKNRRDVALKVKSVDDSGEFEGYGSVFGVKDSYDDIVVKGAFAKSLEEWREKGSYPALLWQHDHSEPIGIYTDIREDDHGLAVKGRLLIDDDPLAKRAHAHMKAGSLSGLSIGYSLPDGYDYDSEKQAFMIRSIDLWEISLVTFPANDEARVQNVKNLILAGETPHESQVERLLRDAGFSRQRAKAFMAQGYKGLIARDANDHDLEEAANQLLKSIKGEAE